MAANIKISVVFNKLPALSTVMRGKAAQAVAKTALDIETEAKMLCPVDTGALKASIQAHKVSDVSWMVDVGESYGVFQEFGWSHGAAQPYLTPAADHARAPFIAAMKKVAE